MFEQSLIVGMFGFRFNLCFFLRRISRVSIVLFMLSLCPSYFYHGSGVMPKLTEVCPPPPVVDDTIAWCRSTAKLDSPYYHTHRPPLVTLLRGAGRAAELFQLPSS